MNSEYHIKIRQLASAWAEQLKTYSSFTDSDAEELESHLIDLTEELSDRGLDAEEAFTIASSRLGNVSVLKSEFEDVNTPIIQMRKAILVMSGIMAYFLLYFLMLSFTRLQVILLYRIKDDPERNIRFILYMVIAFHLFLIIFTLLLHFRGEKLVKKIASLKIKPQHTFILLAGILSLAFADQWFLQIINGTFEASCYTYTHLYTLFDYAGYSFPLIMILCFIVLYKKYYLIIIQGSTDSGLSDEWPSTPEDMMTDLSAGNVPEEQMKNQSNDQVEELEKIGLDEEEAWWVAMKRKGLLPPQKNDYSIVTNSGNQMRMLLIILSGVLAYFFFFFLMRSSARVFFTVLQHFENDPLLNVKRTWSYVLIYQLFFIFLTVSLYILDKNLVQRIKQIILNPIHTLWIFLVTIVLAITDRCFYPITQNAIGQDLVLISKLRSVFYISNYSFPFIILACFLILFYKYYRNNIRV